MHSCDICGKDFPFSSKLLRHLNKKNPCISKKNPIEKFENDNLEIENDNLEIKNDNLEMKNDNREIKNNNLKKIIECERCRKVLKSKHSLNYHMTICKGVNSLTCPTCFKVFSCCPAKNRHIKNVKCSPPEDKQLDMEKEILALRKENAILKATQRNTCITNNNSHNTNINNYTIKYEIKYNPETRCLTTEDPDAPFPELLCFNGFKQEAARSRLKNIDQEQLQEHINNVRIRKDFYSLYSFFFRNVDNRRLQMFNLGKNNNNTHAQVFNNGAIEKVEKSQLFENVCRYIGQYLLNMSIENADVITMLTTEQASKAAFLEVTKDKSHMFEFFKAKE